MITIISCTNRHDSNTMKVAKCYAQLMEKQGVNFKLFSFESLPADLTINEVFHKQSVIFQQLVEEYLLPAQKLVFISPEYNGSFPGLLKMFLDAIHPDMNRGKKTALIGVSTGRAGNLRGMEHLTGILNYLGMHVHPNKLPVSNVLTLMDADGKINDEHTLKVLEKHSFDVVSY